jgi:hypothetical protein
VAGRLIASSKSWLVHPAVDRGAPILPWIAADDVAKMSPVDAAARVLTHVRLAWDAAHPVAPLAEQDVVLTVPASFDPVARELSVEAARRAGFAPRLLEEPQAAFYDWMARAGAAGLENLLDETRGKALVLVMDVGGGTTDLSLVRVAEDGRVERVAVGPHLLLGGDNMDIALAYDCEPRMTAAGAKLDATRFGQLVSACRAAKESLMADSPPDEAPVTVLGTGAKLIGSALTTRLERAHVERRVLDGFFPSVARDEQPARTRGGLVTLGLPFERDPAITRHVAAFLSRHLGAGETVNAVLFNGGVFRAKRVADRVVEVMTSWRDGSGVVRLRDANPDLAVARGAVAYALAREGRGARIGGGTAHGCFVGIEAEAGLARAVCVLPRGAQEGDVHSAQGRTFALAVGRPVRFELLVSDKVDARAGDVVDVDDEQFTRLLPLTTTLEPHRRGEVHVTLEGELTGVGTVELSCHEVEGVSSRRIRLAFEMDRDLSPEGRRAASTPPPPRPMTQALESIALAFGKARSDATGREARDLVREIERSLGERSTWTVRESRALFDAVLAGARARRRSPDHERVFWSLAGWCIRPGCGDPGDAARIAALAPLFEERLAFPAEARGWQQFWVAWRRVAAGLADGVQTQIRDYVDPFIGPPDVVRRPKKMSLSLDDALDLAASLERVAPARRAELGGWALDRTWTDRDPRLWSVIGRVGARVPAYASIHHVVAPHVAERWLDHLLREKWQVLPPAADVAVRLARMTGDRARDVADRVRRDVEERLVRLRATPQQIRAVREVVPVEASERAAFFGDALPLGLKLVE